MEEKQRLAKAYQREGSDLTDGLSPRDQGLNDSAVSQTEL